MRSGDSKCVMGGSKVLLKWCVCIYVCLFVYVFVCVCVWWWCGGSI